MLVKSKFKFFKFLFLCLVLIGVLIISLNLIDDDFKVLHNVVYIILWLVLFIIFIVSAGFFNHFIRDKFGSSAREDFMSFPVQLINAMIILAIIGTFWLDTVHHREIQRKDLLRNLSLYTHKVIVDGWENDAMKYSELDDFYENIFSKPGGDSKTNTFLTKKQWDDLHLPVKYVPYKGHEKQWHYSAKFIQEMVNVVRTLNLQKEFPINDKLSLEKSYTSIYAGWFTCFRKFMSVPLVRNVWEHSKYSHINPAFTAWIQYYIINVVEKDPDFWSKNKAKWDLNVEQDLKKKTDL